MSLEGVDDLQQPEVVGWKAGNPHVPGPTLFFSSPLAPGDG